MSADKTNNEKETLRAVTDGDPDEAMLQALLARFGTFLFQREPPDLNSAELASRVRQAMARRHRRRLLVLVFPTVQATLLRVAAALAIVVGGYWGWMQVYDYDYHPACFSPSIPAVSLIPRSPLPANMVGMIGLPLRFRDGAAAGDFPLYDPAWPPVAYLFPNQAEVVVRRRTFNPQRVHTPCFLLAPGDLITVEGQGGVTVLFPGHSVAIEHPGDYRIGDDGTVYRSPDDIPIVSTTAPGTDLALTPSRLMQEMAVPEPSTDFSTMKNVYILSPFGDTLSRRPEVLWLGAENRSLLLEAERLSPARLFQKRQYPPVRVTGGAWKWEDTGWPPLPRGSTWRLALRDDDGIVADARIRVAGATDARRMEAAIRRRNRIIPEGPARTVAEICALLDNSPAWAGEARTLAMRLWRSPQASANIVYMKLVERAYASMGLPEGVRQMQMAIETTLEAAHRESAAEAAPAP